MKRLSPVMKPQAITRPLAGAGRTGAGCRPGQLTRNRRSLSEFESTLTDDRAMATAA